MDGMSLPSLTAYGPQSHTRVDAASADRPDALVVAADPLVAHGVLRVLEQAGAIGNAEFRGSLEAALSGPAVALVIVDPETPDLTLGRVADLVARRHAMALLAAGTRHGSGLAVLCSAGARGQLTGAEAPALCARMIQLVLAGGSCWTADPIPQAAATARLHHAHRDAIRLTPRQWQVAGELAQGHSNKVIGHNLGIGEGTVKIHMTGILQALGVRNRAAAVAHLIPLLNSAA